VNRFRPHRIVTTPIRESRQRVRLFVGWYYTTPCSDRLKRWPGARWGSLDSRDPRNVRRGGNNRHDDVAALNTGSESACMHNTDGRRGDAIAYQLATHDIGTIGCRPGCLTSFIVAASLDYNNCAAPGV
jgi:hypothetical protein